MEPVSLKPEMDRRSAATFAAPVSPGLENAAVVVIGRNEGERLRLSLESVAGGGVPVLYVDSGSVDGSPELARSLGVEVLPLDPGRPWSAARARNEGLDRILRNSPGVEWIQFLDGDCALDPGWMARGAAELGARPDVAVACGRLKESRPDVSVYNRMCQLEWDHPAGEVAECGGIMLVRVEAFKGVGGFDTRLVAGEDPEFCLRLRRAGWKILRLDAAMASHDAAMRRFGQWWKRAVRTGHSYAQLAWLHGRSPDRYRVRECRSTWAWAFGLPLVIALLAWPTYGWSLAGFALYPLQALRIAARRRRSGSSWGDSFVYGVFCVLSKWPQAAGQLRFRRSLRTAEGPTLIEHKESGAEAPR